MRNFAGISCFAAVIHLVVQLSAGELISDESHAQVWLDQFNNDASQIYYDWVVAYWNYNTNLTNYNHQLSVEVGLRRSMFLKEAYANATKFAWQSFKNEAMKRQFGKITDVGYSKLPEEDLLRVDTLHGQMQKIYSTGKVCNRPGDVSSNCYPLDPDLTQILATSTDWETLLWAWKGWRTSTKGMVDQYEEFVQLHNKAAHLNNYTDNGDYWRSSYEMESFAQECLRLWEQVKPLYIELHAYVKRKLQERYGKSKFPSSGHIPAHILGNMWGQTWNNVMDIVIPYKNAEAIDVTTALKEQGYNATGLFLLAEDFFTSLGLPKMPASFWQDSMIVKPTDRDVVCHASAWDFYNGKDFRIKQCTEINTEWLLTTHHEMGHIAYDMQYKDQPVPFREGANPGFHEAVGDVLALSVATPEHLHKVKLLDVVEENKEADINYLMSQALDKVAFLPFGYLIDQWRWSVFAGRSTKKQYNEEWWNLRCKHQGISPPVTRSDSDFDPGAKFHIPNNTPYIRYFVSFIIQFQFHKALCIAANRTEPLHRCDIYQSKEAGTLLANMLKLGSSQPWPVAMEALTGQRKMDAQPLLDYFEPLYDWLKKQNAGHSKSWTDECPEGSFNTSATADLRASLWLCLILIPLHILCSKLWYTGPDNTG